MYSTNILSFLVIEDDRNRRDIKTLNSEGTRNLLSKWVFWMVTQTYDYHTFYISTMDECAKVKEEMWWCQWTITSESSLFDFNCYSIDLFRYCNGTLAHEISEKRLRNKSWEVNIKAKASIKNIREKKPYYEGQTW